MTNEEAQRYGLLLKRFLNHLRKFPAGRTDAQLRVDSPVSDIGAIIELALAAELIEEGYDGDTPYYKALR